MLHVAPLIKCNIEKDHIPTSHIFRYTEKPPWEIETLIMFTQYESNCYDDNEDQFTWGCLTLSNQEGALRIPRSEEEPHGIVSRNVLKKPPAAQTHDILHTLS